MNNEYFVNECMKAMTKAELAEAAGVSRQTMRLWLKDPYIRDRLASMNLKKNQHILPPAAVEIIVEHYSIEIEK